MSIEPNKLKQIIEGALLASGQPLDIKRLLELFDVEDSLLDEDNAITKDDVQAALEAIVEDCQGRGFELKEVGSGWRFQVREDTAPWVNRLWEEKPQKYSRAMLETLALIAYRQPITRGDIEEIRGVAVSSHIIKTLSEREWVKVVGHRDVPGRPSLYATTRTFLDYFNLSSLEELPSLGELADLEELNAELNLDQPKPDDTDQAEPESVEQSTADADTASSEEFSGTTVSQEEHASDLEDAEVCDEQTNTELEPMASAQDIQDAPDVSVSDRDVAEIDASDNTVAEHNEPVSEVGVVDKQDNSFTQTIEQESTVDKSDGIDSSRSLFDQS